MKFDVIDGCAVPASFAPELREVKKRSGAILVSCDRSPEAAPILNAHGKSTQLQLWNLFLAGKGNPANRPGQSTHERRSDGVAYIGPVGRHLKDWQVGQDWDIPHVHAVVQGFAQIGWIASVTYPNSTRERQHVNVRKPGRQILPFKVLKQGSHGARVGYIRWALGYVHDPDDQKPYLDKMHRRGAMTQKGARSFGPGLTAALKEFQRDHGQKPDGIYGPQTARQLHVSVNFRRKRDKKK